MLPRGRGMDRLTEMEAFATVVDQGGFTDAENAAIRAHPAAVPVSLGPNILRADTAAVAAVSVWMAALRPAG